ncbi:MAG: hypothetical protein ACKO4Z_10570 [Planctomycetota bacterium]
MILAHRPKCGRQAVLTGGAALAVWTLAAARVPAGDPPVVGAARVEVVDGSVIEGSLHSLTAEDVVVEVEGAERRLPIGDVRRVVLKNDHAPPAALRMRMEAVDGTWIDGDDFVWEGEAATIVRGDVRLAVPIQHVRKVTWREPESPPPQWLSALPDDPDEDLVVVTSGDGSELVDCAITAVSPAAVTVVLDGERIPVRRAKVLGLVWSRPPAVEAGVRIALDGGRLACGHVTLEGGDLVADSGTRVPVDLVTALDFAAARSVALCDLQPERRSTEPYVGDLGGIAGVAAFFAPRVVPAAADESGGSAAAAWLLRPRTALAWRLPDGSRRLRAAVVGSPGARPGAAVRMAVRLDGASGWEAVLDAAQPAAELELDVAGVRRLELVLDFVGLDPGFPVRVERAVVER